MASKKPTKPKKAFNKTLYNKEWHLKNRKRRLKANKIRYLENKEQISADGKERYAENREQKLAKNKEWYAKNPEKRKAMGRKKMRKRRARLAGVQENFDKKSEDLVFDIFNNKCFKCGRLDHLSIDHHYPLSSGNALNLGNAVLLCIPCNSSKGIMDPKDFYTKKEIKQLNIIFKKLKTMGKTKSYKGFTWKYADKI